MIRNAAVLCCVLGLACDVHDTIARELPGGVLEPRGLCACDGIVGTGPSVLSVTGDLRSGGDVAGRFDVDVNGDAFVNGALSAHDLSVAGTLHTPVDGPREVTGTEAIARERVGNVDVSAACHCEPEQQRDIDAIAIDARADNDNATIDLQPTFLLNAQSPTTLTLPCGRFYLDGITGAADIEIVSGGAGGAVLVIGGDVATEASLTITAQVSALEVVVAGNVTVTGVLSAGDESQSVRLLVGGSGTLDLGGSAEVGGLLYAPNVELVARDRLQVWGSLLVRRLTSEGDVSVRDGMEAEAPVGMCP